MKEAIKNLERLFAAITFAEAGEFETAEQIMNNQEPAVESRPSKTKNIGVMRNDPQFTADTIG
jgi:hypothetical protein